MPRHLRENTYSTRLVAKDKGRIGAPHLCRSHPQRIQSPILSHIVSKQVLSGLGLKSSTLHEAIVRDRKRTYILNINFMPTPPKQPKDIQHVGPPEIVVLCLISWERAPNKKPKPTKHLGSAKWERLKGRNGSLSKTFADFCRFSP